MLQTLIENRLTHNATKCQFAYSEIEYLDFGLSEKSIRISEKKILSLS